MKKIFIHEAVSSFFNQSAYSNAKCQVTAGKKPYIQENIIKVTDGPSQLLVL